MRLEMEGFARIDEADSDERSSEVHDEIVDVFPGDTIVTDGLCSVTILDNN